MREPSAGNSGYDQRLVEYLEQTMVTSLRRGQGHSCEPIDPWEEESSLPFLAAILAPSPARAPDLASFRPRVTISPRALGARQSSDDSEG